MEEIIEKMTIKNKKNDPNYNFYELMEYTRYTPKEVFNMTDTELDFALDDIFHGVYGNGRHISELNDFIFEIFEYREQQPESKTTKSANKK